MRLVERLPKRLQEPAASLITRLVTRLRGSETPSAYPFDADGLRTIHYSPFVDDRVWSDLYEGVAAVWFAAGRVDVRWRMWVLTEMAQLVDTPGAIFAEFGVYRAGTSFMVLSLTSPARMFLFDTFDGIPESQLTEQERDHLLAGERLADTSVGYVRRRLSRWIDRIEIVAGDIGETLTVTETGPLTFVHIDVNAVAATVRSLEYAWPRLVPGGVIVFDDYAYNDREYQELRTAVDTYLESEGGHVIALPTGQGVLFKTGSTHTPTTSVTPRIAGAAPRA